MRHLFEHMMLQGSGHAPGDYLKRLLAVGATTELQLAGNSRLYLRGFVGRLAKPQAGAFDDLHVGGRAVHRTGRPGTLLEVSKMEERGVSSEELKEGLLSQAISRLRTISGPDVADAADRLLRPGEMKII